MLIDDFITISTNNRNYKKFLKLGYKFNNGDRISVKVEDLNFGCREMVSVRCDICGNEKKITYSGYTKNIKKYKIYACTRKCANFKYENTCLERYGCRYPLQNEDIKNRLNDFFEKKYGCIPAKLYEFEIKKQETNISKYGFSQQMFNIENIEKIKKTKFIKYGDENYNNNLKSKHTKFIKYGDENYNNQIKAIKTNIERYGFDNPMKNEIVFLKNLKSRFSLNVYNDLVYQSSYELDFIIFCDENNISLKNGKKIEYYFNNKHHVYYPDFFIEEYNLICEVKSNYIYNMEIEVNECKKNTVLDSGYNFIFLIDKNYTEFKKIINLK